MRVCVAKIIQFDYITKNLIHHKLIENLKIVDDNNIVGLIKEIK